MNAAEIRESKRNKCLGFRSGVPWKMAAAVVYYLACAAFLVIAMVTPPLVPADGWDTFLVKVSSLVLFLWMISPALLLSDTPLRDKLPFLKEHIRIRSLVGMMIVFVMFQYLFMAVEGLHSPAYREAFEAHLRMFYIGG